MGATITFFTAGIATVNSPIAGGARKGCILVAAEGHLDFAKVRYLITGNDRIRAPLARTPTSVGQPCDVGSTVPLLV
jgi:hypothetical protein